MTQLSFEPVTHASLVRTACSWLRGVHRCHVVLPEFSTLATSGVEIPDVIGWSVSYGGAHSTLVECKVTRADFLADRKKPVREHGELGMGYRRWFLTAPGLVSPEELPDRWGLAEWGGGAVRAIRRVREPGSFAARAAHNEISLLVQAIRREVASDPRWGSKLYKGVRKLRAVVP